MAQKTALNTIATPGQTQLYSAKTSAMVVLPIDLDDLYTPPAEDLFYTPTTSDVFYTPGAESLFYEATD